MITDLHKTKIYYDIFTSVNPNPGDKEMLSLCVDLEAFTIKKGYDTWEAFQINEGVFFVVLKNRKRP